MNRIFVENGITGIGGERDLMDAMSTILHYVSQRWVRPEAVVFYGQVITVDASTIPDHDPLSWAFAFEGAYATIGIGPDIESAHSNRRGWEVSVY
jgi:hypothetical protein